MWLFYNKVRDMDAHPLVYIPGRDYVGQSTSSNSQPVVVDTSPPAMTGQAVQVNVRYSSTTTLQMDWTNVFADQESGK